jgi:biopolymer transport protein ExbB
MSKPNNPAPAPAKAKQTNAGGGSNVSINLALIVIPAAFVISYLIWKFVMGAASNFSGGNAETGHPLGYMGTVYKGGVLVPVLMTVMLTTIIFIFERFFTITKANGKVNTASFVKGIHAFLNKNDISGAIAACDKQQGSVANVVREGLKAYAEMEKDSTLDKDSKIVAIKKAVEETTSLELPMLEKNLVILSTVASVATLLGLLGTVIGMIKSFQAMATAGAPDAVALSSGISEALINTALGIGTSTFAIIFYNYFTTQIDKLTYGIDEANLSLEQSFASKH